MFVVVAVVVIKEVGESAGSVDTIKRSPPQ
jgi:hypothetical protein